MSETKKLKNEDFRKLLARPAHHSTSTQHKTSAPIASSHIFTHRKAVGASGAEKKKPKKHNYKHRSDNLETKKEDDISDESEVKLNEILKNYRDRAAERRKGFSSEEKDIGLKLLGESKEIAGSVLEASTIEAKKMQIQKSKYLGGDMEHTHLVKGLDYSLLNKVRTEIQERHLSGKEQESIDPTLVSEEATQAGNRLAGNISKILFENKLPKRNDLFARGRMAYLVDLDEDDSEVPSTLLRSVCDAHVDNINENINADNLLINKLSQVLAYLRTDVKKKKKVPEMSEREIQHRLERQTTNIFEGLDEYVPSKGSRKDEETRTKSQSGLGERQRSYFDSNKGKEGRREQVGEGEKERAKEQLVRSERKRQLEEEEKKRLAEKEEMLQKKKRKLEEEDAYAELYPGGIGMIDAGGESDDDDFTKMDQGNRKSQIKRWDFESQEDYERHQSQREANPKAVYQFGVKANGGRKTRKNASVANERKIDRELEKINKIMEKGVNQNMRY